MPSLSAYTPVVVVSLAVVTRLPVRYRLTRCGMPQSRGLALVEAQDGCADDWSQYGRAEEDQECRRGDNRGVVA